MQSIGPSVRMTNFPTFLVHFPWQRSKWVPKILNFNMANFFESKQMQSIGPSVKMTNFATIFAWFSMKMNSGPTMHGIGSRFSNGVQVDELSPFHSPLSVNFNVISWMAANLSHNALTENAEDYVIFRSSALLSADTDTFVQRLTLVCSVTLSTLSTLSTFPTCSTRALYGKWPKVTMSHGRNSNLHF